MTRPKLDEIKIQVKVSIDWDPLLKGLAELPELFDIIYESLPNPERKALAVGMAPHVAYQEFKGKIIEDIIKTQAKRYGLPLTQIELSIENLRDIDKNLSVLFFTEIRGAQKRAALVASCTDEA